MERAVPTAGELLEAVREFLATDVRSATDGRVAFLARVAANTVAIVERELELGADADRAHGERLASLGVANDAELARAIRAGALDGRERDLVRVLRERTVERLEIANPRWITADDCRSPTPETRPS